jgi:hypothetical protein
MTTDRMTNAEAVVLCRFAKACCPQQAFDAYTPDAWYELLRDLRFEDCKAALTTVVKSKPFVSPAEIREEVARVRNKRISDYGVIPDPKHLDPDDPDFTRQYHHYISTTNRAIADGDLLPGDPPPTEALAQRDVIGDLGQVGRPVPNA